MSRFSFGACLFGCIYLSPFNPPLIYIFQTMLMSLPLFLAYLAFARAAKIGLASLPDLPPLPTVHWPGFKALMVLSRL